MISEVNSGCNITGERNGRRRMYWEGINTDEISLGTMEDALYFGRKEERLFLLQKPEGEETKEEPYPPSGPIRFCNDEQISL